MVFFYLIGLVFFGIVKCVINKIIMVVVNDRIVVILKLYELLDNVLLIYLMIWFNVKV